MAVTASPSGKFLHPAQAILIGAAALAGLALMPRLVPPLPRVAAPSSELVGKPAPDVTLPVAANGTPGERVSLAALKGRPVLLDFWASWCGPCAMVAPVVDRVARRYKDKGLVVMGVNVDDSPDIVRLYAEKKGLGYPMLLDLHKAASLKYGVDKLPSLVVIGKDGNVKAFLSGIVDDAALDEIISSAL